MIKAEQVPEEVWVQVALRLESCGAIVSNDVAKLVAAEVINAWPSAFVEGDPVPTWISRPAIILPLPQEGEETDWGKPQGKEAW